MSIPSMIRRIFSALWNGLTRLRMALGNILFLLMLGLVYFVYVGGAQTPLPEKAALLLNMTGSVVEQKGPVDPLSAVLVTPDPARHEILLRDVVESIEHAADDPQITALVMELDSLVYVGISKSQEIVQALEKFRATGKPVIATGDYYTQDQYLLASHADEVIVHPLGGVALEGFSSYRNYFREALEKLSVKMHVFRAGDFKSAVEPYLRDDMSPQEKEVTLHWLQQIWAQYTSIVETQRDLEAGSVDRYINSLSETMIAEKGNVAEIALNAGLVDKLMSRDEGNKYLVEVVGASNDDGLYEAVEFERYIARKRPLALTKPEGSRVAVVTAYGNILPGDQPPGTIGGDSLARLIRSTADDDNVAAIVMRVTSGGGSMFASEVVRQQVLYAQSKGLPFVVSMGSVAASGGYYIAAPADQIWATPSTITGSIGVFAAFPTFEDLLQRVGIYTDGVGTTELAGSIRADRPLNPELVQTMNSAVGFAYDTFLEVVAEGRAMSVEDVDTIAQGRVWSASDALDIGLVDALGSLEQAVDAAAELAAVEDYKVDYVDYPLSPRDQFMKQLANRVGSVGVLRHSKLVTNVSALLAPLGEAAEEISLLQDPRHLYMRCVSCAGFK